MNETREESWGGGKVCLENLSLHATLTYFPTHQLCALGVVRYLGLVLGVEAYGKWGSVELPHHMDVVSLHPVAPQSTTPHPPHTHTHKHTFAKHLND